MWWQFWNNGNKVGGVPQRMARQLIWKFGISSEAMAGLQHVSKPGPSKNLLVRVFDPKLLTNNGSAIRGYGDLDAQKPAVQFECQWSTSSSKMSEAIDLRPA